MKHTFYLLAILLFSGYSALSQCNPSIPSNAVVVDSTQTINGAFDPIWVCSGDTLHSDGGFHNIFLEPGSVMTTGGGIDTIYVKSGASFFMYGGIHVIYYVTYSDLYSLGGIPTLDSCVTLNFDYSNAPVNGCFVPPVASFQSSDSAICSGDCISFSDQSLNATSWQWNFTGAIPPTSTDEDPQNICYNAMGNYDVTLIAFNNSGSDTITLNNFISVFPLPVLPSIIQNDDTLFSITGYSSYQWYFDTASISGASEYYYVASQSGDYSIEVTDSNNCSATAQIDSVIIGIEESLLFMDEFTIFPNPATADFTIAFSSPLKNGRVEIYDIIGKIVCSDELQNQSSTSIHLNSSRGIYFVKVSDEEKQWLKKLVLE